MPASIRGRRRWDGRPFTAFASAWELAGAARSAEPSPGAEAGAQQREEDKHEKMPRRGVTDAHLELVHRAGCEVRAGESPPQVRKFMGQERDRGEAQDGDK